MPTLNLLYKDFYDVNPFIRIQIPRVGDVLDHEDEYYGAVSILTAMPVDMMVQLDDIGVDFSTINEWELFLLLFSSLRAMDTSLIFGELDLSKFRPAVDTKTSEVILVDQDSGAKIDRLIYDQIGAVLRKIHNLKRNTRKPANDEARKFMMQRARLKLKRSRKRASSSQLEELIVAMVNSEQYHYGFEGTRGLTIYQFNESVRQVIKKTEYNNRMYGVYAGTVNPKELSQDDLNWLTHK